MKKLMLVFSVVGLLALCGCTSTKITNTWREPNKDVNLDKLKRVLVVALFKDETSRRKAEDQMVGYLGGKGIVSYNYLDRNISTKNEEAIRERIRNDGFDGAITMRLVDVDKEETYNRRDISLYPRYYRNFSGYYFRNWGYSYNPGYYETTKTYTVETNVYSIKEDGLIWSGLTETTNPDGVKKMTGEISKAIFDEMVKEGFIRKK